MKEFRTRWLQKRLRSTKIGILPCTYSRSRRREKKILLGLQGGGRRRWEEEEGKACSEPLVPARDESLILRIGSEEREEESTGRPGRAGSYVQVFFLTLMPPPVCFPNFFTPLTFFLLACFAIPQGNFWKGTVRTDGLDLIFQYKRERERRILIFFCWNWEVVSYCGFPDLGMDVVSCSRYRKYEKHWREKSFCCFWRHGYR